MSCISVFQLTNPMPEMERGDIGQLVVFLQDTKYSEPAITLTIDTELSAQDVVKQLCTKARILNHNSYELAEIFVSSGQLCKERRLEMTEYPIKVQGLWPKGGALAPDATYRLASEPYVAQVFCRNILTAHVSFSLISTDTNSLTRSAYIEPCGLSNLITIKTVLAQ